MSHLHLLNTQFHEIMAAQPPFCQTPLKGMLNVGAEIQNVFGERGGLYGRGESALERQQNVSLYRENDIHTVTQIQHPPFLGLLCEQKTKLHTTRLSGQDSDSAY